MKTTIGIIRLVLRTNKLLSNGQFPIMIRCSYHGMKEKSTGYSCTIKDWDKRNECCKKSFPNYLMINQELRKIKDRAISKRDKYIASDEVYTSAMVLDSSDDRNVITGALSGLIDRYIEERGLGIRTVDKWRIVKNSIYEFAGREILVNEIDESFCRRYSRWLEGRGLSAGTIRLYLGKVGCICHYSILLGLTSVYPFERWKYWNEFKESKSELYIHSRSMDVMFDILLDLMIEREGDLFSYRSGVIDDLLDIHSKLYSLYLYCIGYYLCGIAPVDISYLKKEDIKVIEVKGESVYAIDGRRNKTGQIFKIRLRKGELLSQVLIGSMLMFHGGEYFLPHFDGATMKNLSKRVNDIYCYHTKNLREWFMVINDEIVRRNVENGDNIPLIDLSCKYYSYRHSFIVSQIQKPNVNLLRLATLTGKSIKTLHQYVTLLNDIDLID